MSNAGSPIHDNEDQLGFTFQGFGEQTLLCHRCHNTQVRITETSLICMECGYEFNNLAFNATLEYEDIVKGKGAKMKKDNVKMKAETPKKI